MPDQAIQAFFQQRKEDWLKKNTKASMTDVEVQELKYKCDEKFSKNTWLPDAARRAGQMSISTHPCTFSHPSARKNKNGYVTSIIAEKKRSADGLLRTGNVVTENDALGNAAALDVYKFLSLKLFDGKSLYQHIEMDSEIARALLDIATASYDDLKAGFMAMGQSKDTNMTSSKIKQVFFPINKNYHLLSILSNSGLIYELRNRIDNLRFSEEQKKYRELKRNNKYSETGFSELYDVTTIGYGGTKPQNISVLNNQNGGKARLLFSVPPNIEKRDIHFPKNNFFTNSLRYYVIKEPLHKLHKIFKTGLDTPIPLRNLRSGRDNYIEEILDYIIERMVAVRSVSNEQFREETSSLSRSQKIWLCDNFQKERQQEEDWLSNICSDIVHWIMTAYKKLIKKPLVLGPAEREYIKTIIESHREALR